MPDCVPGLSSSDALRIFHNELLNELKSYEDKKKHVSWKECFKTSFLHHHNVCSVLHWPSVTLLVMCVVTLLVSFGAQEVRHDWLAMESFLILTVLFITLYILAWDDKLKKSEHVNKVKRMLNKLFTSVKECSWTSSHFLDLHSPLSPCVTLQWTARDGNIVNLPCAFLVEGDIIYMRPGQVVLVDCRQLKCDDEDNAIILHTGEVYNPTQFTDTFSTTGCDPQARVPLKPKAFVVKETPFVKNLRQVLTQSSKRPTSVMNNECHQTYCIWVERRLLVIVFFFTLLTNILRYMFLPEYLGHWAEVILTIQIHALLPLTALVFPLLWKALDMYGIAKILSLFHRAKNNKVKNGSGFERSSTLDKARTFNLQLSNVWYHLKMIIRGDSDSLPHTCNILHALGNATSFCCVDKKGVLSWPNPSAEKVFFLTSESLEDSHNSSHDSAESSQSTEDNEEDVFSDSKLDGMLLKPDRDYQKPPYFQVLDLTQAGQNHLGLHFDDPTWKKHIASLKPLGLDILLNTCNLSTAEKYTQFADHLTCASLKREVSIPVVNRSVMTIEALSTVRRRCFCGLAHQIGFGEHATHIFSTEQVLGLYRHVPTENISKDRLFKSKSFIKYKMPMPHMFSVVAKETSSGAQQLFSQGTADLLIDACSDYWDGDDICPLTESERKKILDFYQRTSMASYCTAFSYRPMTHILGNEFNDIYIEVPEDAYELFPSLRSPLSRSWDTQSLDFHLHHDYTHTSFDSLIMNNSMTSVHDVNSCFREQCNQIFIGMITMQYQAKQDVVDLIEDLESACIRFVHFSKENELRSRVFSEKMGLEAGWNCHISLLCEPEQHQDPSPSPHDLTSCAINSNRASRYSSHQSTDSLPTSRTAREHVLSKTKLSEESRRGRRSSAPGAISLDTSLVKFEATPCTLEINYQGSCQGQNQHVVDSLGEAMVENRSVKMRNNLSGGNSMLETTMPDATEPLLAKVDDMILNCHDEDHEHHDIESDSMDVDGEAMMDRHHSGISMDSQQGSSYVTENTDSVAGGLGLANRAKLPKGIPNIRPHVENVDNVPLLVSLFTDCTPDTTKEMLSILQEYGEVVCCLGSSVNIHNTDIFLQADCSISVEPLYTQICMKQTVNSEPCIEQMSPMELCAVLHSLPCPLSINRNDSIPIMKLIALARHHCQQMRHMFLFFMMCQMTISLLHSLGSVALLPPPLSAHHTLWLIMVVTPLLSVSLMANPLDLEVVRMAQGKNVKHLTGQSVMEFTKHYIMRYLPSILICLICHCITLNSFCKVMEQSRSDVHQNSTSSCHFIFGDVNYPTPGTWNGWMEGYHTGLVISQNIIAFQLVLYFVCGSLCYVHRLKQLWEELPFVNKTWCIIVPILIFLQIVYFAVDVTTMSHGSQGNVSLHDVPITTWVIAITWIIILIPLHELVKRREAKKWQRCQKRARLDFGTKLGMNSPF